MNEQHSHRPVATVNGERFRSAPRNRPDRLHYNPDIHWLFVEADGALGKHGATMHLIRDGSGEVTGAMSSGSGGTISNNGHIIDQFNRRISAVSRWRRLMAILCHVPQAQRVHLRVRYIDYERQHTEIRGLRAAYSDLAGLAWHLAKEAGEDCDLRDALGRSSGKKIPIVSKYARLAERENRRAHRCWIDVERQHAANLPIEEGPSA